MIATAPATARPAGDDARLTACLDPELVEASEHDASDLQIAAVRPLL